MQHRSVTSQTEIVFSLRDALKEEILRKVRKSSAFGILTDEVADVVTFIQFYCRESEEVVTKFMSCQNILEEHKAANSESITNLLIGEIEKGSLDIVNLLGFSAMVEKSRSSCAA